MSRSPFPALRTTLVVALLATLAGATPPPESPFAIPQPPFFGQVRTRTELDHKAMTDTNLNKSLLSTQLRTRLGFLASPSEKVEIKVEIQDSRTFGSEPNNPAPAGASPHLNAAQTASTGSRAGVDLLQGYIAIQEGPVKVALGRQKMTLGAGRYMSTLEWSPNSRAFDGISANWSVGGGDLTGLVFLVKDTAVSTTTTPSTAAATDDRLILSGLHYNIKLGENPNKTVTIEASAFYDKSTLRNVYSGDTLRRYDLYYLGQRTAGQVGLFAFEGEIIYQIGKAATASNRALTSAAFQSALRLGLVFPKVKANVGVDVMSGDNDDADGTTSLYRANYYFAHAYYGWMDYFVANPKFGVVDWRADVDALVWQGETQTIALKGQYHYFTPQKEAPTGVTGAYGQEIDAEIHLGLYPKSNIVIGAGAFIPGASASRLGAAKLSATANDETGFFFYLMPTFNF